MERDPQVIMIVDYGPQSWQAKRDFPLRQPALKDVQAIRDQRFVVLSYLQVTPSVENGAGHRSARRVLHPQSPPVAQP